MIIHQDTRLLVYIYLSNWCIVWLSCVLFILMKYSTEDFFVVFNKERAYQNYSVFLLSKNSVDQFSVHSIDNAQAAIIIATAFLIFI